MDKQELRTLRLLEEFDKDQSLSQRDLSQKLNMSLGLVNSFVKRLVKKGYCKITTIPKKRVKYMLTPKGVAEKTKLTYDYILFSYAYYKDAQQKILYLFNELEKSEAKNIVFWGTGELSEIAFALLNRTKLKLVGCIDGDHAGRKFHGFTIIKPSEISSIEFDKIVCTEIPKETMVAARLPDGISEETICYFHR